MLIINIVQWSVTKVAKEVVLEEEQVTKLSVLTKIPVTSNLPFNTKCESLYLHVTCTMVYETTGILWLSL